ncbi:hypothetical protein ACFVUW_11540 [Streptomyces xiamenensis]|uniref:hypothetical protein n=1 Tax=Streptomyces xiamenensis TaxID=408015 RepID=UPI0036E1DFFE
MTYRNREGQQIGFREWADLWHDMTYRVVAEDQTKGVMVRTVWEGMPGEVGTMFATGLSHDDGASWKDAATDARTEADALAQHHEVLGRLSKHPTA